MLNYLTPNTGIEVICLAFAIICLANDSNLVWRSMILYIFITCIAEVSGIYFAVKIHNNNWVYNIFLLFETSFNNLMFVNIFNRYIKSKLIIIPGLALFIILYVLGLIDHGFLIYNNFTYTVMSVLYVLYSLLYYYLLIKDEKLVNLKSSPEFWWVAGTLFFYFSNTACNLFDEKLENIMVTPTKDLSYVIFAALDILLYSCWSYSFVCRKWEMSK
jgi:hypothetical protein